ncbi:unnamed protein product [Adineta steineri]|uniref:NAD(P)(+)--arginine ADP-ribosyltransferase n=1 Tax=Adineta steineri TaxID=433720 RepID=A0A814PJB9_9BILA|nr:unnamed protein product [Adineta steineri]CAF3766878.1 unnamed protein product [Adineta steineri]
MATATLTTRNSLKTIEWKWQSNPNPWSKTEPPTWSHYSDVENLIIERAFLNKQSGAILDAYYIDFESNRQISINNNNNQRPIERIVRKKEDQHLREERFMDLPVASDRSFGGEYGWVSPFVLEVRKYLGLCPDELPSKKPDMILGLVEKAAHGIIEEGKHIGKEKEAEELANILQEKKNKGIEEVWECCAYLYSLESFLYKTLNANMRLVGSKEEEHTWRQTVRTLGPFCLLLWDDPYNKKVRTNIELYRGAKLKPEQIAAYKKMAMNENEYGSFQGFSSCSRNRGKAERFGNALFIMKVLFAFTADISELSKYPKEEEELVTPGVCFRVMFVEEEPETGKYLIYLELRQRFSTEDHKQISIQKKSNTEEDAFACDIDIFVDGNGRLYRHVGLGLSGCDGIILATVRDYDDYADIIDDHGLLALRDRRVNAIYDAYDTHVDRFADFGYGRDGNWL